MRLAYSRRFESGRGLPQSKTLSRLLGMSDSPRAHRSADSLVRVARCCTWLQLVAACCSYREKFEEASMKREISTSQREIQDAETVLCGGCVALCRIISDGSAEGGKFKVSGLKFKVAPLKTVAHCAVVARKLGWRAADCGFSGGFARPAILHPLSSIIAFGGRAAARPYRVFHLVSACFTWFQLSGKKEEASVRSEIPSWQRVQPFVKHQIPTSKHQRMFKWQSPNDLLANVRIGLGAWELVLPWSLDVGAWSFVAFHAIWALFCSIYGSNGCRRFTLFHLVALTTR